MLSVLKSLQTLTRTSLGRAIHAEHNTVETSHVFHIGAGCPEDRQCEGREKVEPGEPPPLKATSPRRHPMTTDLPLSLQLSDGMSRFHEYFKAESRFPRHVGTSRGAVNAIYEMADGSFSKRGMNLRMYLSSAGELRKHLTVHHTIEERHIFPLLAKRMPTFKDDEQHIKSHHGIHEGLDKLGAFIEKWLAEPATYSPEEMKACLDGWREVLFRHLDEEVEDLRGENMKKYWTLEEVDRIVV
ncbi:uncharacterized protein PHACADRAFT_189570 [Phanerochaete carnosa HHB-10118-sp]|uniref:Hemerythrin-like domain-containing protein n=1 Tax=Phanerochaete carnosa (strain HHB-10118-sp) TaxID=650164 RepID=K5VBZ4_PHACS|nr:uncharacterized protein PHACADRAFT_189570 [Phanerochaete carnosa HHB-10118-sp]EKM60436.1 hypothetical protein PHACADRAFT_189570 [Phanerochaete carnosa HHB-10118-sp]